MIWNGTKKKLAGNFKEIRTERNLTGTGNGKVAEKKPARKYDGTEEKSYWQGTRKWLTYK